MNNKNLKVFLTALALLAAAFATTQMAQAHCDSLDGPVVNAARAALTESNVNLVLIVKGIHDATARATHGHFPETAATPAAAHPHKE